MACLAVHVELHCGAARGDEPADVSSAWVGSHSGAALCSYSTAVWYRGRETMLNIRRYRRVVARCALT